jgi:hypothetical protein
MPGPATLLAVPGERGGVGDRVVGAGKGFTDVDEGLSDAGECDGLAGVAFCCGSGAALDSGAAATGVSPVLEPDVTDGEEGWHASRHKKTQDLANMLVFRTRSDLTQVATRTDAAFGASLCYRAGMRAPGHR